MNTQNLSAASNVSKNSYQTNKISWQRKHFRSLLTNAIAIIDLDEVYSPIFNWAKIISQNIVQHPESPDAIQIVSDWSNILGARATELSIYPIMVTQQFIKSTNRIFSNEVALKRVEFI